MKITIISFLNYHKFNLLQISTLRYCMLLLAVSLSACNDKEDIFPAGDYFILGTTGGQIAGYVSPSFLVNKDGAFKSKSYLKPDGQINSHNERLADEQAQILKELQAALPSELINYPEDSKTFGCPGCADQIGYYIEFKKGNTVKKFVLDSYTLYLPANLKEYVAKIEASYPKITPESF